MAKVKLNGVSDDTLAALDKQYQESDNVKALGAEVSANYSALKSAGSENDAAAKRALGKWKNYGEFSYNPDTDVLFQNAKANAIANGKAAMEDTVGQASALTGGYANSYAASAGSQAYQNYLKTLDDDLANYYQIALDNYERGKNDLLTEYSLENERGQQAWDRAYSMYGIADSRYQNERGFDYGKYSDDYGRAMSLAGMENSDYWKQTEFDEGVRRYDQDFNYQKTRDDIADAQWENEYGLRQTSTEADIAYKQGTLELSRDEFDWQKEHPTETSGGETSNYRNIDGYIASWGNKLSEAGNDKNSVNAAKNTISNELTHLYYEGSISPTTFVNAAMKYLGEDYILKNFSDDDLIELGLKE